MQNGSSNARVLADNRDEFLARPASPAQWRDAKGEPSAAEQPGDILCGLDSKAGGTWFGTTRSGSVAILTNFTEPAAVKAAHKGPLHSRGELVFSWLREHARTAAKTSDIQRYLDYVSENKSQFGGFNLMLGSVCDGRAHMGYVTNRGDDKYSGTILTPPQGTGPHVNALSNSTLSTPWPKVHRAQAMLHDVLEKRPSAENLIEETFGILSYSAGVPRVQEDMRNTICVDPVPLPSSADRSQFATPKEQEENKANNQPTPVGWYGTRTSTVLLITRSSPRRAIYVERDVYRLQGDAPPTRIDFTHPQEGEMACKKFQRRYEWTL